MAETTTKTYAIRHATESDVPTILAMIKELAIYEKELESVHATEEKLLSTLSFPSNPAKGYAKTLLVFRRASTGSGDGETIMAEAAGMAMYFHNYSTWHAAPGIYLEDLFVREECRGLGLGKALLQALARECIHLDCRRLEWSVLKWNKPSINFYESEAIRATMMSEWVGMRVDGDKLVKLASGDGAAVASRS